MFVSVGYHLLKGWAAFGVLSADVWVKVLLNNGDAVVISVFPTLTELAFYGLIRLIATFRVAGVDHATKP